MITLRGKLTRTFLERKSSIPIATRSVRDASAGDGDGGVTGSTATVSASAAIAPTPHGDANTGSISGAAAGHGEGGGGTPAVGDIATSSVDEKLVDATTAAPASKDNLEGVSTQGNENQQLQGGTQSVGSDPQGGREEAELVEEWTWKGVWAFGTLRDGDEVDDLALGIVDSDEVDKGTASASASASEKEEKNMKKVEGEDDKSTQDPTRETVETSDDSTIQSTLPQNQNGIVTQDGDKTSSGGISHNRASSITAVNKTENEAAADVSKITPSRAENESEIKSHDAEKVQTQDKAKSQKSTKTEETNTSTSNAVDTNAEKTTMQPRPFSYRFHKSVDAKTVAIPSSLIVVVPEESSKDKQGGTEETKQEGGVRTDVAALESDKKAEGDETQSAVKDGAIVEASQETASNGTATTPKPQTPQKRTYGDAPFTDAGKSMPTGTCPMGGKWEGHFENIIMNPIVPRKRKDRRDNRVREIFHLFFNATPPTDATTSFSEDQNKNDGSDDKLKNGRIHVRGTGSNRFGTFEIVGSYHPKTGVLHCQRMYVATPSPAEKAASKSRNRRRRSVEGDVLLEEKKPRKRKSSLKKRELDAFEQYPFPMGSSAGNGGSTSNPISFEGDLVDKVKKRSRKSVDNSAKQAIAAVDTLLYSTMSDRPGVKSTLSKSDSNISAKPNLGESKATSAATSATAVPKAPQSVIATKISKKSKTSPTHAKVPKSSVVSPLKEISDLPTCGDPLLARWRSAHYFYYQRVDQVASGDNQTSATSDIDAAAPGGGNTQVSFVVYEGEVHDSLRDGRGICLYNNNTMYEGEWKKNKEHGKGTLMTADRKRIIYEGDWERGRMHGSGTYYYYEETPGLEPHAVKETGKYVGEFRENLRNGLGLYILSNGSSYDGEWRENNMHGWGVFRWPDGSVYEGFWKEGRRHGASGRLLASDGFRYEGAWVNNGMEGRGIATYPNGQIYEGMWVAGRREGRGTIRFTNGAIYEGRFKDDYMEGQGTLKMSQNVIIPKTFDDYYYDSDDMEVDKNVTTSDSKTEEISEKNDWMIPIEFQSDISHIHQKAGFTQVGL